MKKEIWKTIKSFKKYQVSSYGRVRNKDTKYILKPTMTPSGGSVVCLCRFDGRRTSKSIARLMMLAFKKKPPKFTPTFKDGNVKNLSLDNLKRGSRSENLLNINRRKNKLRGVSKYNNPGMVTQKYRAYLSLGKMKSKTIGYFNTEEEARIAFFNYYKDYYGVAPYVR
jgi:NUMOD4 motif